MFKAAPPLSKKVVLAPHPCLHLLEDLLRPPVEVELRLGARDVRRGVAQRRAVRAVELEPGADFLRIQFPISAVVSIRREDERATGRRTSASV